MKVKKQKTLLLIVLMLFFISETVLFFWPQIGIFINALVLNYLLISAFFDKSIRNLLLCLTIFPAARLFGFLVPNADNFFRTAFFYYFVFVLSFGCQYWLKINYGGFSFKKIKNVPLMILIGILFGFLEHWLLPSRGFNFKLSFGLASFFILFFGYTEEFLFRGLIQRTLKKISSPFYSILFTSLFYSVVHLANGFSHAVFVFFLSLTLSTIFYLKKNIFLTTVLNTTTNITLMALG